jgi:hypothetical protein
MLAECARTLLRRWPWVAITVIVALVAGAGTYKSIAPGQQSTAQVLFLPPLQQPGVKGASNPYLGLGPSLAIVASIVQVSVTDSQSVQRLYDQGNRAKFRVTADLAENAGPILIVTVDDESPAMVQRTLQALLQAIPQELARLQATQHVPSSLLISTLVLTSSQRPTPVHKSQVQKAVIVTVGMLVLLVVLVLVVDRLVTSRRRRVRRRAADEDPWGEPLHQQLGRQPQPSPVPGRSRAQRRLGRSKVTTSDEPFAQSDDATTARLFASSDRPE